MPLFSSRELLGCLDNLVEMDKDWFPETEDPGQLYVRFNHISTDSTLGVKSPASTKLIAILNPTTLRHLNITVKCSNGVNKNWPLGHGQYTASGNIGPLMPTVTDAKMNGFDDVLWLLDDYVQEMTVFNVFFVIKNRYGANKLYTPIDNGTIMPGVTRSSILELSDQIERETDL
jgi:branched-chain amino acid aminotransferase